MKYFVYILIIAALAAFGFSTVYAPVFEWQRDLAEELAPVRDTRLLFVGDIMLDRSLRNRAEREPEGYATFFGCASSTFALYDIVVANLEGPVTTFPSVSLHSLIDTPESFQFTMSPEVLPVLRAAGIDAIGVANNHIYDFGRKGLEMTRELVPASGLGYFGDPSSEIYKSVTLQAENQAVHVVPFNEFIGTNDEAVATTLGEIAKFSNSSEPIIVFAHWGNEYVPATDRVKKWARQFIDAGADAVIGTHPHVAQETEYYKGTFIAYSLGNFVFDQYFNEAVRNGAVAELIVRNDKIVESRLLPVTLDEKRRPCIGDLAL